MGRKEFDLVVLESLWDNELGSKISVKPFFDGLSEVYGIKYAYQTFYDDEDISYFIKKSKSLCSNYYIAAHGSRECLHSINDKKIDVESLHDIFKNSKGKGIFFGSCKFINEKNAEEFLNFTKADWVAGYNSNIGWFDSTVIDLAFWRYYLRGDDNKRGIKETQWKVAPLIYKNYPLSINLKFSVFDKTPYANEINNSLLEFKQDNPDFIKLLKNNLL